jgi:hypothetical protein
MDVNIQKKGNVEKTEEKWGKNKKSGTRTVDAAFSSC